MPDVPAEALDPTVHPARLRTEDDSGLVATGIRAPRLSWQLASDRPAVLQEGYELQVAGSVAFDGEVISTGLVESPVPVLVPWPAPPLASREVRWWRVRVRTDRGATGWSEPYRVEGALLEADDWVARPVTLPDDVGRTSPGPVQLLRRDFRVDGEVASARLYVTAMGLHDVALNGQRVSDELLEPGWQTYHHRLLYATYDVTDLLGVGDNAISAQVGDGWYRGKLTWKSRRNTYGDASALLAQLEIRLADGRVVVVATDEQWRAATGEVREADLYDGTTVDLRLLQPGWRGTAFDDSSWKPVAALELPRRLEQRSMPPVRVVQVRPLDVPGDQGGALLLDAGQNLTGYLRLRVRGARGDVVTVRHAEVLDDDGRLHTAALRDAKATDAYVLGDDQPVTLEPVFTFHGFRHAEVQVPPGATVEAAEVAVVTSDLRQTGEFECSDERVNQLFSNVVWSQRGNFLAVPTDCPQRDERLGWTGDIMVFAPTACTNADSRAFLANWLVDLALDQRDDGAVPAVVPNVLDHARGTELEEFEFGATGWGDAASVVPWTLYEAYGDIDVLRRQYPSMRAWVDWCASRCQEDGAWVGDFHFGDWLDPGAPPDEPQQATTSSDFIATAYLAHSAGIVARTAELLGDGESARRYATLGRRSAAVAWRRWADHAVTTQTGCAIALQLGIAPTQDRPRVGRSLARLVRESGGRISTGFLGTPLVLPALTGAGHVDEAYQLLLNTDCPGWLYQVLRGATTMWERWDAVLPDGSIHSGEMALGDTMLSFNHYAYGAVAAWLYRTVAGLATDPDAPGYAATVFAPEPGGGLTHARAAVDSPFGTSSISWTRRGDTLTVDLEIPPGAVGRFVLPPRTAEVVQRGEAWNLPDLAPSRVHGRRERVLGSGRHALAVTLTRHAGGSGPA